tara:strand:+ start:103 stop:540 length:438 start_codon:yes stop_codon:yes gene_type:complete
MSNAWNVLLVKSENASNKAKQEVRNLKFNFEKLVAQGQQLDSLIEDYHQKLISIQKRSHSSSEGTSYRNFIVQLENLKHRSIQQVTESKQLLESAKLKLTDIERERLKYESLVDRANTQQVKTNASIESKAYDDQGTLQYHWKQK